MKRRDLTGLAMALAVTAACAAQAWAVWVQMSVTGKNPTALGRTFTVTETPADGFEKIDVTVTRKEGQPLSPFTRGSIYVIQNGESVGELPLQEFRQGADHVSYSFKLNAAAAAASHFQFEEQGWQDTTDPDGKTHPEMTLGGKAYLLTLGDFTHPAK